MPLPRRKPETQALRPSGQARSPPCFPITVSSPDPFMGVQTLWVFCLPQASSTACPFSRHWDVPVIITRQPNPVSELSLRVSESLPTGFGLKGQKDRSG